MLDRPHPNSRGRRPTPRRGRPVRWWVPALALALVAAACGGSDDQSAPSTTATSAPTVDTTTPVPRSAPRWETVVTLTGTGPTETAPFAILDDAIQWRARWKCETGNLRIETQPPPRRPAPMVDEECPGPGQGFAIVTGDVRMTVDTAGPWEVIVDQQVDTALVEAPLAGMDGPPLAEGSLYDIEREGTGTARLYRLPDGGHALRLEDARISENTDLFVWLSEAPAPATSAEALAAPYVNVGNLKSTLGSQNYLLPPDLSPDKVKSVVIWCEPVRIAYAAATLAR